MSLFVNDPRRGRSKSPGPRERSRSRDTRPPPPPPPSQPIRPPPRQYYDEDSSDESSDSDGNRPSTHRREEVQYEVAEPKHRRASSPVLHSAAIERRDNYAPAHDTQYMYNQRDGTHGRHPSYADPAQYEHVRPAEFTRHSSYSRPDEYSHVPAPVPAPVVPNYAPPGQYKWEYDHVEENSHRPPPPPQSRSDHEHDHERHMSLNTSGSFNLNFGGGHQPQSPPYPHPQYAQPPPLNYANQPISPGYVQPQHGYASPPAQAPPPPSRPELQHHRTSSATMMSGRQQYAVPERYQYAEPPQQITYTSKTDVRGPYKQTPHAQIIEVKPNRDKHHEVPSQGLHRLSISGGAEPNREKFNQDTRHEPPSQGLHRLSISGGAGASLSVGAPGHGNHHGGLPPGSPLLEAYKGTYQSISPLPSPTMHASSLDDGLSDLELDEDGSDDSRRRQKPPKSILKKHVSIYDPEDDARALASALKHSSPESDIIVAILPHLTDDHIMALRTEYKKHMKVGGKGINIAKHIKMKVPGNFGKIAYATALGRWESEAYWANFWYQSGTSRRELLIESLMGRSNSEIRAIKEAFSDKRYGDSLEKCMQTELKKDKFRYAVLLALEEKKTADHHALSNELIRRDTQNLHRALTAKEGGETAMIDIIVMRSDPHMREVLRAFEATYKKNFTREMIQKSRNLVVSINLCRHSPESLSASALTYVLF